MMQKIIEINIKNSTITNKTNKQSIKDVGMLPDVIVEIKNSKLVKNFGEANIINKETIRVKKPKTISITEVKNLELNNWFFVTGKVCVK